MLMKELAATTTTESSTPTVLGKRQARRQRRRRQLDLSSAPLALTADERELCAVLTVKFGKWLDRLSIG